MVIQRIQTVYLLLAAIIMGVFAFVPVIKFLSPDGLFINAYDSMQCGVWMIALEVLIAVLAIITIFKYRDLKGQIRLTNILMLLLLALIIAIPVVLWRLHDGANVSLTLFYIMPFVALILVWLAKKGIKHDKKLLADSERIR